MLPEDSQERKVSIRGRDIIFKCQQLIPSINEKTIGRVINDGCGDINNNRINKSGGEFTTSSPTHPEKMNGDVPIKERDDLYESMLGSIEYELKKLNLEIPDMLVNIQN